MPNQYTKNNTNCTTTVPCASCGKPVTRNKSRIRFENTVCSNDCRGKLRVKYTAKKLKYVQDNVVAMGFAAVAEHLGVSHDALKRQISLWRSQGIKIPYLRKKEEGDITEVKNRGYKVLKQKVNGKFVYIGNKVLEPRKRAKKEPAKVIIPKVAKKTAHPPKNGDMIAGKNLINLNKSVIIKNPRNPEKYKMVYDPSRRLWVEKKIA